MGPLRESLRPYIGTMVLYSSWLCHKLVLKEKIRKIYKGTKRLIGMKRGKMLQNKLKNRGESRILEAEKASGIKALEFPSYEIHLIQLYINIRLSTAQKFEIFYLAVL